MIVDCIVSTPAFTGIIIPYILAREYSVYSYINVELCGSFGTQYGSSDPVSVSVVCLYL